eukprot:gene20561-44278_t
MGMTDEEYAAMAPTTKEKYIDWIESHRDSAGGEYEQHSMPYEFNQLAQLGDDCGSAEESPLASHIPPLFKLRQMRKKGLAALAAERGAGAAAATFMKDEQMGNKDAYVAWIDAQRQRSPVARGGRSRPQWAANGAPVSPPANGVPPLSPVQPLSPVSATSLTSGGGGASTDDSSRLGLAPKRSMRAWALRSACPDACGLCKKSLPDCM